MKSFYVMLIVLMSISMKTLDAFSMRSPSAIQYKRETGQILAQRQRKLLRQATSMKLFDGIPIVKPIWDRLWELPVMQPGEPGKSPTSFGDAATVLKGNLEQMYGDEPSIDGAPVVNGEVTEILGGQLFLGLNKYYRMHGPVYKLLFGPKSFLVVSDPVIIKHILKDNAVAYDKGVLAEILEPIMGKGLIPADPDTWKVRRRAIVPGFHKEWYAAMCNVFAECNEPLIAKLSDAAESGAILNMETEFNSVALDIIGKTIFNYDFGSVTKESPVIQAVYTCLKEAESRSVAPLPYWDLPMAKRVIPRLRRFTREMDMLNDVLNDLIKNALETQNIADEDELLQRDYTKMENPSLLRFLVDMRGENTTSQQLRDDLMTMLIAGHETTAAVLTWALFEVAQQPELLQKVREEIEAVVGDRTPTFEDIPKLQLIRLIIAESLRMYPEPPLLIRRALVDDELPAGNAGFKTKVQRGADVFIAVYSLHRSAEFWENPDKFDPERFLRPYANARQADWEGYTPNLQTLYPNEVHADYAYLPFGAGQRKCVGDQFACMEAAVTLTLVLRDFDFRFKMHPKQVGITTGATIHTKNGLMMGVKKRVKEPTLVENSNSTSAGIDTESKYYLV